MPREARSERRTTEALEVNELLEVEDAVPEAVADAKQETSVRVFDISTGAEQISAASLPEAEAKENSEIVGEAKRLQSEEASRFAQVLEGHGLASETAKQQAAAAELAVGWAATKDSAHGAEASFAAASEKLARLEARAQKGGKRNPETMAELAEARAEYQAARIEYVGDSINRYVESNERQIEDRRKALESEKGFGSKVYDAYKKLGNLNLEAAGWKPKSRAGKIIAKAASVRTVISLGLVGVSAGFGAGAAVGIAAIAGRRLLSGLGASIGTYDFLKSANNAKLNAGFPPLELQAMSHGEVVERMEAIEANALVGGRGLEGNEAYAQLKARFIELASDEQQRLRQVRDETGRMGEMIAASHANQRRAEEKARKGDLKRKGIAAAVGLVVGSGALAKFFGNATRRIADAAGGAKKAAATAAETAVAGSEAPQGASALETPAPEPYVAAELNVSPDGEIAVSGEPAVPAPSEKALAASAIIKGDGYSRVIQRDLMAEPEKFGYVAERDGEVGKWARKAAKNVMRENGLLTGEREMRFAVDSSSGEPARVSLSVENGHIAVAKTGIREYAVVKGIAAAAETHDPLEGMTAAPKPEAEIIGRPVAVETAHFRAEGDYDPTGDPRHPYELGHVEHEFRDFDADKVTQDYLKKGGHNALGTGKVKDVKLVQHLYDDRRKKLLSLREGYMQAAQEGKYDLADRLRGDYGVLARATNRDIGDVFHEDIPFKQAKPIIAASAEKKPIEPPAFEPEKTVPLKPAKAVKKAAAAALEGESSFEHNGKVGNVEFVADDNGKIVSVDVKTVWTDAFNARVDRALADDWFEKAQRHVGGKRLIRSKVLEDARYFYAFSEAEEKLSRTPGVSKARLAFMQNGAEKERELLVKKYGDIFRK